MAEGSDHYFLDDISLEAVTKRDECNCSKRHMKCWLQTAGIYLIRISITLHRTP
jgi:hypothetical protein